MNLNIENIRPASKKKRWLLAILASPFVLFFFLTVLLYLPPIQQLAVDKATALASEATGLNISVGRIALSFPLDLVVKDVQAISPEYNDTLLDLERLEVHVQLLPLLKRKVEIDGISLVGGVVATRDFLDGIEVNGHLGELFLESHGVDFDPSLAVVNDFIVKNSDLRLTLTSPSEPNTTATDTVYWKFDVHRVALENVTFALDMPHDTLSLIATVPQARLEKAFVDLHKEAYSLQSFGIRGASIRYDLGKLPSVDKRMGLDPMHLDFQNIHLQVDSAFYAGRDIRANLSQFSWKERSGLELLQTEGRILADSTSIYVPNFRLKTTDSQIDFRSQIAWDVIDLKRAGLLSAHLSADFGKADIAKTIGGMDTLFVKQYPDKPMRLRVDADGSLNCLKLTTLSASLPGSLELNAEGELTELTDTLNRGGSFDFLAEVGDMRFLAPLTDGAFALPDGTSFEGVFAMKGAKMGIDLLLKQPQADVESSHDSLSLAVLNDTISLANHFNESRAAHLSARYNAFTDAYQADVMINDLDMHQFLPKDSLFDISATLKVHGEGLDFFDPETRFRATGKIDKFHFTTYRLAGYNLEAQLENHQLDATLIARNSAMEFQARMDGKLKPNDVSAHLQVDVSKLDWKSLQLTESSVQTSHRFDVSFVSDLLQKYVIDASMTQTSVKAPKKTFSTKDLYAGFATASDSTTAYMRAGDLDVDFHAKGYVETLMQQVNALTTRMDYQWTTKTVVQDELKSLLPSLCLKAKSGKENPIGNYLNMFAGVSFDKFFLDIDTSPEEGLNGEAYLYQLATDSLTIDTLNLELKHHADGLDFLSEVISAPKPNQEAFEVNLDGTIGNGNAQFLLQYLNAQREKGCYIGVDAELRRRGIRMKLFPEKPILMYRPFNLNKNNRIYLTDRGRILADVRLYDEKGTGLSFYTNRADTLTNQDMTLELARINLKEFRRIMPYMPDMDGWLGGEAHYIDSKGSTMLSTDLRLDDYHYEGSPLGSWEMGGVYLPVGENEHHVDAYVRHEGREITHVDGIYQVDEHGMENLVADLELSQFPLYVINPFVPDKMVEFTGQVGGSLSMTGTPTRPILNGGMSMDSVSMALPDLSVLFNFDNKPVQMVDSKLTFNQYNIFTKGKNPFTIDGSVDLSDLEKMAVDLRMKASDYELMNAPKNRRATTFGKIYVDVDATLKGPVEELKMRGNMNVLGKTNFTYVLKDSPLAVNDRLGDMVTFVNFNDTVSVEEEKQTVALTGMDISMTIHIDQAVQARVHLTPDASNYMLLEGGGDLAFQYTPQGEMRLNGRYSLMSGELKYEIPVIPLKTFHIREGSYVDWTGNVMNPTLGIKATERVRASVGSDGQTPRMVSFDVGIALSQRLENLGLAFTLEAPEDASVQEQLNAMSAEERGKLAVTMLVTGMYMAEGNATGGFNMNNALNSFLQSQISNIAGKTVDINLGMETVDNAEGGRRTDYNFQFAKRFWNNRFRIVIGGTVSTGNSVQQEETFIDNISIEYRLDNSGTRYVKLFHDKNYESVLEGEVIETGIGVVLRKKVSNLGELFIFKKKKEDENEE